MSVRRAHARALHERVAPAGPRDQRGQRRPPVGPHVDLRRLVAEVVRGHERDGHHERDGQPRPAGSTAGTAPPPTPASTQPSEAAATR